MEMVLESEQKHKLVGLLNSFNPSSNGNGAGINVRHPAKENESSFNPSSNGNGAGILI